jgi:hypothetical protein
MLLSNYLTLSVSDQSLFFQKRVVRTKLDIYGFIVLTLWCFHKGHLWHDDVPHLIYILIILIYITGISNDGLYEYQNVILS